MTPTELQNIFANTELLNNHANQYIIQLNGGDLVAFVSYQSLIALYNNVTNDLTLYSDWDYSRTTLKHLCYFINNYTIYSYTSRRDFELMARACESINFKEAL